MERAPLLPSSLWLSSLRRRPRRRAGSLLLRLVSFFFLLLVLLLDMMETCTPRSGALLAVASWTEQIDLQQQAPN